MEKTLKEKLEWLALTSKTKKELAKNLGCGRISLNRWLNGECEPQNALTRAKIDELWQRSPSYYDVSNKKYPSKFKVGDYVEIKDYDDVDLNGIVGVVKDVTAEKFTDTIYGVEPCLLLTPQDKQESAKRLCEDAGFAEKNLKRYHATNISNLDITKAICEVVVDEDGKSNIDWTEEDAINEQIANLEEKLAELKKKKLANKWHFTADEKVILRNLSKEYAYITRDLNGELNVWTDKPNKSNLGWIGGNFFINFEGYVHLFKSVQYDDEEPCRFRNYLEVEE